MPRVSTAHCPIPGSTVLSTIKQMSCFRTGCTSGQIKNSRKTILWYYTGFRKGGRLFPIPLATVLKSACMTLENKQDVMSMELLFPRQLKPPQPDGITAGEAAQPSSDLKKRHHPFHWTRVSTRFLQPSPSCLPGSNSPAAGLHKFTAGLQQSTETQHACRELRQKNLTLLLWSLCRAANYSKSQPELPPSLTTETKAWDPRPNGVQKQSAGFHGSQSFEAKPRTYTSEQIKT